MDKNDIFVFAVDRGYSISPRFEKEQLNDSVRKARKIFLKIYGHKGSSLIAINQVADYFYDFFCRRDQDVDFEWAFIRNDLGRKGVLYARVCFLFKLVKGGKRIVN